METNMGWRIKHRRESLGLSQKDVADAVGVDRSTVTGWERGHRSPERKYLAALANVLQTTVDYLINGNSEELQVAESTVTYETPAERLRRLGIMLRSEGATEEDVQMIMDLIEARRRLREAANKGNKE